MTTGSSWFADGMFVADSLVATRWRSDLASPETEQKAIVYYYDTPEDQYQHLINTYCHVYVLCPELCNKYTWGQAIIVILILEEGKETKTVIWLNYNHINFHRSD